MFKTESKDNMEKVVLTLDGKPVSLPANTSVAAGLLRINETISRISPTSGEPRSPHCLMGVCFECTMEIDGVKRQTCLTEAKEGMNIQRRIHGEKENEK